MTTAHTVTLEKVLDHMSDMRNGKFDLRWMHANPDGWGTRAKPSTLGLTLADINVGKYGVIPAQGDSRHSMAPRGSEIPDDMPSLGTYDIDDRGMVWSDNCAELYEEAIARQWSSARDIPWDRLRELPDDIERAVCQLCTQLTEVEFAALDPRGWRRRPHDGGHDADGVPLPEAGAGVPPSPARGRSRSQHPLPDADRAAAVMEAPMVPATFPSVEWFGRLAAAMDAAPARYRKLGPMDLTLVPRIVMPDGRTRTFVLVFRGFRCVSIDEVEAAGADWATHPVALEGDYGAWREMIENIRAHDGADLDHTLNFLTLPDWPLRIVPLDESGGQLDADRFYRYIESLQEFFNEAAHVEPAWRPDPLIADACGR
jgi:hypothetical protein